MYTVDVTALWILFVFSSAAMLVRQSRRLTQHMCTGEFVASAIDRGRWLEVQKTMLPTFIAVPSLYVTERLV